MMNGKLILFHGSDHIIEKPKYGQGKANNDYGRGFYCTCDKELAKEWACPSDSKGYANHYILDTNGLRILDLNKPPYNILHWLTILLENRIFDINTDMGITADNYLREHYHLDTSAFDIIIGYRADDSYFSFASSFLNGGLTLSTLSKVMRLGGLGQQVFVRSEKAFERLVFKGFEIAEPEIYHKKRTDRDNNARETYRQMRTTQNITTEDILIYHIITGAVKDDDPRLQF